MSVDTPSSPTFEEGFARLESILKEMNGGALSLDRSLRLYEEAHHLIQLLQKRLTQAEGRIASLVKERNGELRYNPQGEAETQPFAAPSAPS